MFVRKAIFRFVFLKRLVTSRIKGLWYVKVMAWSLIICGVVSYCRIYLSSLVSTVCGKPLAWAMCNMVVHSFCLNSGFTLLLYIYMLTHGSMM